jgi:cytochrome P450
MDIADEASIFNPLGPGYGEDPYSHLAVVREKAPVQQTLVGPWALFGYDDVFALLRDPDLSVDDTNSNAENDERALKFEELAVEFDLDARGDTSESRRRTTANRACEPSHDQAQRQAEPDSRVEEVPGV